MRSRFHDRQFACAYEKRLSAEGYPGVLLDIVLEEIDEGRTIIDVGAGTGFFSIPLARMGYRVIAIEPSPEMVKLFMEKINEQFSQLVSLNCIDWESWHKDRGDNLICIHSIYGMQNIDAAIKKMSCFSNKSILIIKAGSGTKSLSEIICKSLNIKRGYSDFFYKIEMILQKNGLKYRHRRIEQRRNYIFIDLNKEAEYYCKRLDIDKGKLDVVKKIIESSCQRDGDRYVFQGVYKDILFVF
ncbi:MAG: methyltransferase domain-containing protein [Spirochaetota bacterium]|nr:methyltransferase domain-containing protein [Spirochaetota bacterium]